MVGQDAAGFQPNDILLVIGSSWTSNDRYLNCLLKTQDRFGLDLAVCVFDVIPWKLKHLYATQQVDRFRNNCSRLLQSSSIVLTFSQCSAKDIATFAKETGVDLKRVEKIVLGDDQPCQAVPRPTRTAVKRPFALYVSTMDIRKNHRMLLALWERLATALGDAVPSLVFLGGLGTEGAALKKEINESKTLSKLVIIIENADDETRDAYYRDCLFTVYPSLYEGWGMPVSESLVHGKICFASSAGSLPEVAPGILPLLDPEDIEAWLEAILPFMAAPAEIGPTAAFRPRDWLSTARTLIRAIDSE